MQFPSITPRGPVQHGSLSALYPSISRLTLCSLELLNLLGLSWSTMPSGSLRWGAGQLRLLLFSGPKEAADPHLRAGSAAQQLPPASLSTDDCTGSSSHARPPLLSDRLLLTSPSGSPRLTAPNSWAPLLQMPRRGTHSAGEKRTRNASLQDSCRPSSRFSCRESIFPYSLRNWGRRSQLSSPPGLEEVQSRSLLPGPGPQCPIVPAPQ